MRSRFFGVLQLFLDLALVAGSYYLVYAARGALGFPYEQRSLLTLGRLLPWLLLTFVVLYFVYNLGAGSPGGYYESFLGLVLTVVLLMVISFALSFAIRQFGLPRTMVALAGLVQVLGLSVLNGLLFRLQMRSLPSVRIACAAGSEDRATHLAGTMNGIRGFAATPFVWSGAELGGLTLPAGIGAVVLDSSLDVGVRRDLLVRFGPRRVLGAPISESASQGCATAQLTASRGSHSLSRCANTSLRLSTISGVAMSE